MRGTLGKARILLCAVALLLAGGAATVRGQSALDGFDPNVNGAVEAVVVQPDGYTPLGNGSAAGSNWTLNGLNLATEQTL